MNGNFFFDYIWRVDDGYFRNVNSSCKHSTRSCFLARWLRWKAGLYLQFYTCTQYLPRPFASPSGVNEIKARRLRCTSNGAFCRQILNVHGYDGADIVPLFVRIEFGNARRLFACLRASATCMCCAFSGACADVPTSAILPRTQAICSHLAVSTATFLK